MTETVFVDTNVFVYARDASEPEKQLAADKWLRQLWVEQRGRTSIQVLSEYYVTMTRKLDPGLDPDDAWTDINALLAWEPQAIDRGVITRAREIERSHKLSWWDSMIVSAAQLQNCVLLLTEDLQHGLVCGAVTVCSPFADEIAEEQARHAAQPEVVSRHRPRGRPRRGTALAGS